MRWSFYRVRFWPSLRDGGKLRCTGATWSDAVVIFPVEVLALITGRGVCVVADRGMISAETIAGLEERGLEYILGVRERSSKEVYEVVLNDPKPSVSLVIARGRRPDTELEAKDVWIGERRCVVCRNLNEAKRDAEVRAAVLRSLRKSLRGGDKALVGNSAYRRYLKTPDDKHFEIDEKRVAEDARYDGLYVLRTNMRLDALAVMLRYRELLKVEDIFRTAKSILDTRPIYHQTDEAIRGHVFCSFLALVLSKVLEDRLAAAHLKPEWGALIRQLDRLQEIETEQDDKHFVLRTPVTGDVGRVFQAVGVALPPNIREADAEAAAPIR
jgi:Transposase DDE domain